MIHPFRLTTLFHPLLGACIALFLWSLVIDVVSAPHERRPHPLKPSKKTLAPPNVSQFRTIVAFGDGLTDTFFDHAGPQPGPGNPFGNSDRAELIMSKKRPSWMRDLRILFPSNPIVLNMAWRDGKVERDAYEPWPQYLGPSKSCDSLREQVRCFGNTFAPAPHVKAGVKRIWNGDKTLFTIWVGLNDILEAADQADAFLVMDAVMGSFAASIEQLYSLGGRHFLILNVPPFDRAENGWPKNPLAPLIESFNARLQLLTDKLRARRHDTTVFLFDTHSLFNDILADPSSFEETRLIKDVDRACLAYQSYPSDDKHVKVPECEYRKSAYFWMEGHFPGYAVHKALAGAVWRDCFGESMGPYCTVG